jgi:hypothetical protein
MVMPRHIEDIFLDQKLTSGTGAPSVLTFLGNSKGDDRYCGLVVDIAVDGWVPESQFLHLQAYLAARLTSFSSRMPGK